MRDDKELTNIDNAKALNSQKWKSRRWIITVWSMILLTAIIGYSMVSGNESMMMIATVLAGEATAYTSLETLKKNRNPTNTGIR